MQTYLTTYPGRYFTGDGCHRDVDGYYWITGRVDDVLNVSGHRLGTAEIEGGLVLDPMCAEAAVVGYPHDIKGVGIYAFVLLKVGAEGSPQLLEELRDSVAKEIGPIVSALGKLSEADRHSVLDAAESQNAFVELFSCDRDCASARELPEAIRKPLADLFYVGFKLLTSLGIRDRLYAAVYVAIPGRACPACGCEYFDAPGAPREDLDHYLPRSRYPLAAANLWNLLPMGRKCNSAYKSDADILRRTDGIRRSAFNPFSVSALSISLDASVPFAGTSGECPAWVVEFQPTTEETETWDEVFSIRERYVRDVLDPCFTEWVQEFRSWAKCASVPRATEGDLILALQSFEAFLKTCGWSNRAFLKAAVFRMLWKRCEGGDGRLVALLSA